MSEFKTVKFQAEVASAVAEEERDSEIVEGKFLISENGLYKAGRTEHEVKQSEQAAAVTPGRVEDEAKDIVSQERIQFPQTSLHGTKADKPFSDEESFLVIERTECYTEDTELLAVEEEFAVKSTFSVIGSEKDVLKSNFDVYQAGPQSVETRIDGSLFPCQAADLLHAVTDVSEFCMIKGGVKDIALDIAKEIAEQENVIEVEEIIPPSVGDVRAKTLTKTSESIASPACVVEKDTEKLEIVKGTQDTARDDDTKIITTESATNESALELQPPAEDTTVALYTQLVGSTGELVAPELSV
jgi:hypothetical protein